MQPLGPSFRAVERRSEAAAQKRVCDRCSPPSSSCDLKVIGKKGAGGFEPASFPRARGERAEAGFMNTGSEGRADKDAPPRMPNAPL